MGRWFAGILAAIISGVGVAYFSGLLPMPPEPARTGQEVGFIVSDPNSPIRTLGDLTAAHTVCGTRAAIAQARATPSLSRARLRDVPPSELYQAMQLGVCSVVFVEDLSDADALFPVAITDLRLIPVR